jgi:hypothetical protein
MKIINFTPEFNFGTLSFFIAPQLILYAKNKELFIYNIVNGQVMDTIELQY